MSSADLTTKRKAQSAASKLKAAYETAGPRQLRQQPSKAGKPRPTDPDWLVLRESAESRLNMLRSWRYSWVSHWTLLEAYLLPRRGIFINAAQPTPNTMIRGIPINQAILDSTGTRAMRRCAAGMFNGLMSPSRPWFRLKPAFFSREETDGEAAAWFDQVESRMYTVMARSNFYTDGAEQYQDIVTFGTGPQLIYEDEKDIIRCYTPCPGEYFLASSSANRVETFDRMFVMTISAIVEMFELDNCPLDIQKMWQQKGSALEQERLIAHSVEPNFPIDDRRGSNIGVVPGDFDFREIYWIYGGSDQYPLSLRGFTDQPFVAPRWAVTSNDAYGRSVGMDCLPDIMQLQVETGRKAEALEKLVRPPMLAHVSLKNEPTSILPGKVTFSPDITQNNGMRPIFTVTPPVKEIMEDLQDLRNQIKEGFFNDLFAMLETADKTKMTAYEVAARNQEKLQILGPVIERLQNEDLGPKVHRIFRILERKNLLPPLPKSLQGIPLDVEYVGMLSLAQKAASTASLERFAATLGSFAAQQAPQVQAGGSSVMDMLDADRWVKDFAEGLSLPGNVLNSDEKVSAIRDARAKQAQQAQQMQMAQAAVDGAGTLGKLDVGGGQNAIQAMLGNNQGGGA